MRLWSNTFEYPSELAAFVNEQHISSGMIQAIVCNDVGLYTLFWWEEGAEQ